MDVEVFQETVTGLLDNTKLEYISNEDAITTLQTIISQAVRVSTPLKKVITGTVKTKPWSEELKEAVAYSKQQHYLWKENDKLQGNNQNFGWLRN